MFFVAPVLRAAILRLPHSSSEGMKVARVGKSPVAFPDEFV
jgi:hypothetical protein